MTRGILALALIALTCGAQHFPPLDQDNPPKSRQVHRLSFCMTARKSIPLKSAEPLFTFEFEPPGATGYASIDGKQIMTFKNEQHLQIYGDVVMGDHRFNLRLTKPTANTKMSSNDDFKYCKR
jgi:hypothetical protein